MKLKLCKIVRSCFDVLATVAAVAATFILLLPKILLPKLPKTASRELNARFSLNSRSWQMSAWSDFLPLANRRFFPS